MKKILNIDVDIDGNQVNIIDALRTVVGDEGSRLNPVQDEAGDWFISPEEWNCGEFQRFKINYSELVQLFSDANYTPKKYKSPI